MNRWLLVIILGSLAHFGASFLVPLAEKDQGALGGVLRWAWPWSVGDRGFFGIVKPEALPTAGLFLALTAAVLAAMAALAVLGIWVPSSWWRGSAVAGATSLLVVMAGFFGPTKILPMVVALAAIWFGIAGSRLFQVG